MSQALSNLSFSLPLSSKTSPRKNLQFLKTNGGGVLDFNITHKNSKNNGRIIIKAMAESRDNLDRLQRDNGKQQNPQPKKRVAPVAPVGLWDRFPTARTVQQMMETMERMMDDDPFTYSSSWPSAASPPIERGGYGRGRTPWEIKEGQNEYKMRFDMPGMTKQDVKVWVEEKMLVVKAEKLPKKKNAGENYGGVQQEEDDDDEEEWSAKSYGRYSSRIALPENIQFEKIKAEVKDGVLYITIPKATSFGKILDINVQ